MDEDRKGCRVRRSPGLAVVQSRSLPAALPVVFTCDPYRVAVNERFAAVVCALSFPPYSRAAATAFLVIRIKPSSPNRLPEHEVRGDSGPQRRAAGLRLTTKLPLPFR